MVGGGRLQVVFPPCSSLGKVAKILVLFVKVRDFPIYIMIVFVDMFGTKVKLALLLSWS